MGCRLHLDLDAYPLLTPSEERRLAQRIEQGDERALEQLVASNLRLVISVAARYRNRGLTPADLVQEGSIGLLRAAQKFDWRRGLKFSTYAVWWIEQAIVRAVDEGHNAIRVPALVGYNRRRVIATRERLRKELDREPTRQEQAEGAGISVVMSSAR